IVWGAYGNTGGRYDPATDTWTPMSTEGAPSARWGHIVVWAGSLMIVWGGEDEGKPTLNTGGRYDPATDSWTPTSTLGSPLGRAHHTAVWTGSLVVVWGGGYGDSQVVLNTGGRYDP